MKIGILETGEIHDDLLEAHGEYPSMFERMLHSVNPEIEFFSVKSCLGEMPESPAAADGWIITGSKHGVYDELPWIAPLMKFLQKCIATKTPVAGICFGHQILAEALGGKVVKSSKGWGIGVQSYDLHNLPAWMDGTKSTFAGHAVHQDQIINMPPNATVIASSDFCQYAAVVYGDPEDPLALSVQSHPEFGTEFVNDLIDVRMKGVITSDEASQAHQSLGQHVNNDDWARWLVQFFELTTKRNYT